MPGQQKFQIVSTGKTLRAAPPQDVLRQAARAFSVSAGQARKLLLKGWVIKDELTSGQVVQYRTQLQQIGLRVEVYPAGKFDNRVLLSRLEYAQRRRERKLAGGVRPAQAANAGEVTEATAPRTVSQSSAPKAVAPAREVSTSEAEVPPGTQPQSVPVKPNNGKARQQLVSLFDDAGKPAPRNVATETLYLWFGIVFAATVPMLFALLAAVCLYQGGLALWRIPAAIMAGEFGAGTVAGSGVALLLLALFASLFLWPYYRSGRALASEHSPATIPLKQSDAPGLFLLLEVLQEKTGLPLPRQVAVTPGADIAARSAGIRAHLRGEVTLTLGLASARGLSGGESLALIARALCFHRGLPLSLASWLVTEPARRLESMQVVLESEQTPVSDLARNGPAKVLQTLLASSGLALIPIVERLQALHRLVSGRLATRVQGQGDAWAAHIIGSDAFTAFAERWHQLVHADLVTGEINREAQLMGKRLQDYPAAVQWLFENLDQSTRLGIEVAMGEEADIWNPLEPANNERVFQVEEREVSAVLAHQDFSLVKLFADFAELSARISKLGGEEGCRVVENRLLMTASEKSEQAQKVLAEYFNRAIPRDMLPLEGPKNEALQRLDLQETIDWLRERLVELQELEQRRNSLLVQAARIQLGTALIRASSNREPATVDAGKYHLNGFTPAAADESRRDNRARMKECMQQRERVFSMFYQRIEKSLAGLGAGGQEKARKLYRELKAYKALAEPLSAVEGCGDLLSEMVAEVPAERVAPPLVQKYINLAVAQVTKLREAVAGHAEVLGDDLSEALVAFVESTALSESEIPEGGRETADRLQAVGLCCKSAGAVVLERYHHTLASLLRLCLEEERRLNIRPLRLAAFA
ncbi:hypothetical protein [Microbulbifer celer]|uniref:Uncharacterized protein n=1 Tax=Microbulbifer celer TaxID=435905 RepID=A0ABW3U6L0_9GAMM|nr:hypothetical protein [Microbulbifer celer]UFN58657.1 hypothetical protein LPW13_06345 [Microbulbifer celer]